VGSAKVSEAEVGVVRHHLLDVADNDPDTIFSVKSFVEQAEKAIEVRVEQAKRTIIQIKFLKVLTCYYGY